MECNRDCFNCKYPDCICDDLDVMDYDESAKRDKEISREITNNEYYLKNREKRLAYQKEYYQNNKEKCVMRNKAWRKNNADKVKEYKHKYYLAHKDKWQKRSKGGN